MAHIMRARRVAYDNIAVGSATGPERTYGDTRTTEGYYERLINAAGTGVSTEPTTVNDATRERMLTETAGAVTTLGPRETMINTN